MAKKKKKYYVVWKGNKTGVLDTWEDCKQAVHGFNGAEYKSFDSLELAEKAYSENYDNYKGKSKAGSTLTKKQLEQIGKPILNSVSVDAACSGNPGKVEYQCVETSTKKRIFHYGPLLESTNNVGEFLGLVHTLAHMAKTGDTRPIYTDSKIAMSWVKRKVYKTKLTPSESNAKSFQLMDKAVTWLKTNEIKNEILKWETKAWGEIPADFGRK